MRHVTQIHQSAARPGPLPNSKNVPKYSFYVQKCFVFYIFLHLKVCSLCFCRMSVIGNVMNFIFSDAEILGIYSKYRSA